MRAMRKLHAEATTPAVSVASSPSAAPDATGAAPGAASGSASGAWLPAPAVEAVKFEGCGGGRQSNYADEVWWIWENL